MEWSNNRSKKHNAEKRNNTADCWKKTPSGENLSRIATVISSVNEERAPAVHTVYRDKFQTFQLFVFVGETTRPRRRDSKAIHTHTYIYLDQPQKPRLKILYGTHSQFPIIKSVWRYSTCQILEGDELFTGRWDKKGKTQKGDELFTGRWDKKRKIQYPMQPQWEKESIRWKIWSKRCKIKHAIHFDTGLFPEGSKNGNFQRNNRRQKRETSFLSLRPTNTLKSND